MPLQYNNQLVGRAEQEFSSYQQYEPAGKSELGRDDFLVLLVEQLKNQDPLNPMEDTEFTAQLANFSSLEQLTEINDGIGSLSEGNNRQEMLSAVSFIGKEVMARGQGISKRGDDINTMSFAIDESAANVYVNIFDENGNIVQTIEMGALTKGEYDVEWDGLDYDGVDVADGVYNVAMAAENADGEPILVDPEVSGKVKGVNIYSGAYWLQLEDGREVNLLQIKNVIGSGESSSSSDGVSDDPEDEEDA